ncbi:MAG TPA: hypothetical protein VFK09_01680 [Gemmatimonadales bacterium]|jgi:hypothetical protein|nr:hypothetical protein [Gemmatimonadales bacterium]
MCYLLYMASPLTLSEVRSMLPPGITADLALPEDQQALRAYLPAARTVVRLLSGSCSCNLVIGRDAGERSEERHLRARWFERGMPRAAMIDALYEHRKGAPYWREPLAAWHEALAGFIAEHARNAGPTLYYLHFGPGHVAPKPGPPAEVPLADTRARPGAWLQEGRPTVVSR